MTTQRCIVKGTLGGTVQVRNMFTADVIESGGDTAELMWGVYLTSMYSTIITMTSNVLAFSTYEMQNRSGGQWVTFGEAPFALTGANAGDYLPNSVAFVLIAKAAGVRHMGRKFFSAITETTATGNALTTAALSAAAGILLAYITPVTGIGGGTLTPGVLDKSEVFRPFVGGFVSSLLGSMRRRKPGNGI